MSKIPSMTAINRGESYTTRMGKQYVMFYKTCGLYLVVGLESKSFYSYSEAREYLNRLLSNTI